MRKLSLTLSLLFVFGQVLMPSLSVAATTLTDKNETAIIENTDANNSSNVEVEDEVKEESNEDNQNSKDEIKEEDKEEVADESKDNVNDSEETNSEVTDESKENVEDESLEDTNSSEQLSIDEDSSNNQAIVEFGDVYETVKKSEAKSMARSAAQTNDAHYEKEEYAADMNALADIEYLVNKTDSNFEVVLSMGDGVYQYVDSTDTIEEAIDLANSNDIVTKRTSKARSDVYANAIPSVIDSNGVMVYSTNAMGRILKHYNGVPYYGSDIVTYLYKDYSSKTSSNYINQGYVDDTPIIEDRGNRAKIQVAGYTGWINKDTSAAEYDLIVVPLNNVKNPSYYENVNGELSHWISQDITTANRGSRRKLGPAPSFMKPGVKYYSYDGNYFYTDLNTLISDAKAGHKKNSVNSSEMFYSYYQTLPFRSKTTYSASDLNNFIAANTDASSKLRGTGQAFINAQNKYGVNAATMLGIAINESAWGTSYFAVTKNNLFGLEAYDSNPDDAKAFSSVDQCIDEFANYWISKGYADPQDDRYYGGFLGGKALGANVKYASDPFWGEKAASNAFENDKYLSGGSTSLRDYNSNIIGIFTSPTTVMQNNGSSLYSITSTLEYNASYVGAPIVLTSTNKQNIAGKSCYIVNPDRTTPLSLGGGAEFVGTYDWNTKGYIDASTVKVINSRGNNTTTAGISYKTHVRNIGWQGWVSNGETAGTIGKNLAVESFIISLDNMPSGANIKYRAHVQDIGWQDWVSAGEIAGTVGKVKNVEAIQVEASGLPNGKTIIYRTHVQDYGWQPWQTNGQVAGTTGKNKKVEAIEIKIVNSDAISVAYNSYVAGTGWQNEVRDGQTIGTTGQNKRMDAIKISMVTEIPGVGVQYKTHVQDIGWQNWVGNGQVAGALGQEKKIEAIQIQLTGAPTGYHIEYRAHVQDIGWQGWVRDGQVAGTTGQNKKIEAMEIRVVKNSVIDVMYNAHVEDIGWQQEVANGALAGTTGKNKQVEALKIRLNSDIPGVGIRYKTHVQDIGWQSWVSNGALAGTTGKNKHVEAIQIELTGAPAGYHIEYRVHVQDIGWQGWVRNGQVAGTVGKNKQVEAIEIRIIKD